MGGGNFSRMAQQMKEKKPADLSEKKDVDSLEIDENCARAISTPSMGMVERMADNEADNSARIISIWIIDPDPDQPRVVFRDIEEKAKTIRDQSLLHAIVIRPHPDKPGRFMIIDGERRWRAYTEILSKEDPLEFSEIRATVKNDVEDVGKLRLLQLLANIQRDELNPMEEARALASIKELNNFKTNKELANAVGKSETRISRSLKLLKLSSEEQEKVINGELSVREIQNNKGVEAARDGSASKPKAGNGEEKKEKLRTSKVSISVDTATNLALILKKLAEQKDLAGIALSDHSKKELIAVLEARSGDVLGCL